MSAPLPISQSVLRANTTEKVFERGVNYAQTRAVGRLRLRGSELSAHVLGTDYQPYVVRVRFDLEQEHIEAARCTCPYEWEGWCKHVVATLLVAMDHPERVQDRDALDTLLGSVERDGLIDLLFALVEADPRLIDRIEHYLEHGELPETPDDETWGYDDDLDERAWDES